MIRRFASIAGALLATFVVAPPALAQGAPDGVEGLAQSRDYTSRRISSTDPEGRNADGTQRRKIQPGETRTIAEIEGAGIIRHIWMTIATSEPYHLKKIVLRMYWDGETEPSVEAPIGDFFGLGLGEYVVYESAPLSVASQRALNSYFPMPFSRGARITITNEGKQEIGAFYYNIDYEERESIPDDLLRFHAQYRQATPTAGWTDDWVHNWDPQLQKQNRTGAGNYVILEAKGRGHYVGATQSILQNQSGWWGEGDDMMFIDGEKTPSIVGTGAEDYYLGAWCYGGCSGTPGRPTFAFQRYGNPLNGGDERGAKWMVYRYHLESPVTFTRSIKVTIEAGHANHRSDNYFTTAYWYQTEPHAPFPPLPPVADRIPQLEQTGGPGAGKAR